MPGLTHLGVTGVAGVIISHIGYFSNVPAPLTEHCTPSGGADSVGMAQWAHPHHLFLHCDLLTAKAEGGPPSIVIARAVSSQKLFESRATRAIDCRVGSSRVILGFCFRVNRVNYKFFESKSSQTFLSKVNF